MDPTILAFDQVRALLRIAASVSHVRVLVDRKVTVGAAKHVLFLSSGALNVAAARLVTVGHVEHGKHLSLIHT